MFTGMPIALGDTSRTVAPPGCPPRRFLSTNSVAFRSGAPRTGEIPPRCGRGPTRPRSPPRRAPSGRGHLSRRLHPGDPQRRPHHRGRVDLGHRVRRRSTRWRNATALGNSPRSCRTSARAERIPATIGCSGPSRASSTRREPRSSASGCAPVRGRYDASGDPPGRNGVWLNFNVAPTLDSANDSANNTVDPAATTSGDPGPERLRRPAADDSRVGPDLQRHRPEPQSLSGTGVDPQPDTRTFDVP